MESTCFFGFIAVNQIIQLLQLMVFRSYPKSDGELIYL